jgi:hypothetical protein
MIEAAHRHERPPPQIRPVLLAVAASFVIGCSEAKTTDTAACEQQTLRFYSDSAGDNFMIACMEARGYRFDVEPIDCDSKTRMAMQPPCYTRQNWVSNFIDSWRRPLSKKGGSNDRRTGRPRHRRFKPPLS